MDCNINIFIWIITGDYESDCDVLERNVLKLKNYLWNVIGVKKLDWEMKEMNV